MSNTKKIETFKDLTRQNTGTHFLDSGGENGRHWQQGEAPTELFSTVDANVGDDSMWGCVINTGEFLDERLEILEELNGEFDRFSELEENEKSSWFELVEAFKERKGWASLVRDNTCNGETDLSQEFIFEVFATDGDDTKDWIYEGDIICIQTHNGADIRGGYSKPFFARASDFEETSWLQWTLGWSATSGTDENEEEIPREELQKHDEEFQPGYSSNPTYHLNEEIEEITEVDTKENAVTVKLKSGVTLTLYPTIY